MERWLVKMAMWARNPPSSERVKLVFGVIAICLVLVGIEMVVGFPDWLVPQPVKP